MELYEFLFTLYKYEKYYDHNNKISLTKNSKKIDKIIIKTEVILFNIFNDLYNENDFDKIKTYDFKFLNDKNLEKVFNNFKYEKKEELFKLFKDLNHKFDEKNIEPFLNNDDFINSFLIPKFINKLDKKNIEIPESTLDEFSVLNVDEYEKNLENLGLPVFYHP